VTAKGAMSFRMDYRLNGRRETIYLGKYGPEGLSPARAREKCIDARRNIAARYSHYPGRRRPDAGCPLLYRGIRQEQSYFISLFFGVRFGFGKYPTSAL
jgi:hypothetical protein